MNSLEAARPGLPRQVERIDRDAVAAQSRAGIEAHEAKRFRRSGIDDFPHVDLEPRAHESHLVHEPDVHAAKRVFEQLDHLGDLRGGDGHHVLEPLPVEMRRDLRARRRDAAHDLRDVSRVEARIAGVHASFGREREEEIASNLHARRLKERQNQLIGRARVGRALENDEHAAMQVTSHLVRSGHDVRDIRIALFRKWCGDANVHGVHAAENREVRRGKEVARSNELAHFRRRHILNVGAPLLQLRDTACVDVDAGNAKACLREFDGERSPTYPSPMTPRRAVRFRNDGRGFGPPRRRRPDVGDIGAAP